MTYNTDTAQLRSFTYRTECLKGSNNDRMTRLMRQEYARIYLGIRYSGTKKDPYEYRPSVAQCVMMLSNRVREREMRRYLAYARSTGENSWKELYSTWWELHHYYGRVRRTAGWASRWDRTFLLALCRSVLEGRAPLGTVGIDKLLQALCHTARSPKFEAMYNALYNEARRRADSCLAYAYLTYYVWGNQEEFRWLAERAIEHSPGQHSSLLEMVRGRYIAWWVIPADDPLLLALDAAIEVMSK